MAKIDKMLEMMTARGIERATLISDRPLQLYIGGQKVEGTLTPDAQLLEIIEEVVPPQFAPMLRDSGAFHFTHVAEAGVFDLAVENFVGTLHINIIPLEKAAPVEPAVPQSSPPDANGNDATDLNAPTAPPSTGATLALISSAPDPSATPNPGPTFDSDKATFNNSNGLFCVLHPQANAAGVCAYSGKFYCAQCLVEVEGKNYGKENLGHVMNAARQNAASPHYSPSQGQTPPYAHPYNQVPPQAPPYYAPQNSVPHPSYPHQPPIPSPHYVPGPLMAGNSGTSPCSKVVAALLAFILGFMGAHHFYLGNTGLGIVQLMLFVLGFVTCGLTWGVLTIWLLIEIVMILCGGINDSQGRALQ